MTTGPSQEQWHRSLAGRAASWERQATSKQELGQQLFNHIAAHGIANHHAQLVFGDALAVLEVRQWQALEAEAFSQRHAATT